MTEIEALRAEAKRLNERIDALSAYRTIDLPGRTLKLNPDEHYAGAILGTDGLPEYDLIVLGGHEDHIDWEGAKSWAHRIGGELPTRQEQALLYAHCKGEFEDACWYWSCEQAASDEDCAWCQNFGNGLQTYYLKVIKLRARAVRRVYLPGREQ